MNGIQKRLAAYRKKNTADWRKALPTRYKPAFGMYGGTWQKAEDMPRHASPCDRAYYCDNWPAGLRYVNSSYDVSRAERSRRVDHKGWYTDSFQDGTLSGHVLQLPGKDRKPRYIPGTAHSDWDGVTIYPLDTYDNAMDAACAADQYAERQAKSEREYNAKDQAEQQTKDLRDRIGEIRAEMRSLVREMKAARRTGVEAFPSICAALRSSIADLHDESHKAYKRIESLADDYWLAVESY